MLCYVHIYTVLQMLAACLLLVKPASTYMLITPHILRLESCCLIHSCFSSSLSLTPHLWQPKTESIRSVTHLLRGSLPNLPILFSKHFWQNLTPPLGLGCAPVCEELRDYCCNVSTAAFFVSKKADVYSQHRLSFSTILFPH